MPGPGCRIIAGTGAGDHERPVAGIDAGKNRPDIHPDGEDRTLQGGRDGFRAIAERFRDRRPDRALVQSLHAKGFAVSVAHTRQCRDFAGAGGKPARTDRVDARVLAALGVAFAGLPLTQPRGRFLDRLGDMLVAREHMVDQQADTRQILSRPGEPVPRKGLLGLIASLGKAIARLDLRIEKPVAGEATHAERYRIPVSIPGIGPAVAAALISWMTGPGSIGNRQAAALIGVAPMARDSGTRQGARHVAGGRRRPRDVLCMAALSAKSHNPQMIMIHQRLRERGKHHNAALVAVMRKLVVTANALLRDGRTWSERAPA